MSARAIAIRTTIPSESVGSDPRSRLAAPGHTKTWTPPSPFQGPNNVHVLHEPLNPQQTTLSSPSSPELPGVAEASWSPATATARCVAPPSTPPAVPDYPGTA